MKWCVSLGYSMFNIMPLYDVWCLDINKFLWMVRIGGSTPEGAHIKENDYYTPSGEFRVDSEGSSTMLNCLMYKLCYYRFGQVYTEGGLCWILYWMGFCENIFFVSGRPPGYDRVRNAEIGNKDFELDVLEEAYTSEHWIVRIYKVRLHFMNAWHIAQCLLKYFRSKTCPTEGHARDLTTCSTIVIM